MSRAGADVSLAPAAAVHALRGRRSARRLQRIDRFDAFYQAYITALVALMCVLFLSEWTGGLPLLASRAALAEDGSAALGVVSALAVAAGLRSGARGGPLALEAAEVRHVVLSPVPRSVSLRSPARRQLRFLAAVACAVGGIVGQVASHRLPGHALAWTAAGALWACATVTAAVGVGWLAAGSRWGTRTSTLLATALVGSAVAEVVGVLAVSPMHWLGLLGVLPLRVDPFVAGAVPACTVLLAAIGLARLPGTSVEHLARRSALVAELRFAATMRDLRTVMLLRRQLHQERPRRTPWLRTRRRGGRSIVVARDWRALKRTPASRVLRVLGLTAGATAAAIGTWNGTTALAAVAGLCAFLVGLELLEPLAQEIDRCTILDLLPVRRGEILVRHLIVPTVAGAVLATGAALAVLPFAADAPARTVVVVVAVVAPLAAVAGAAISILRDSKTPGGQAIDQLMLPPEAVGMRLVYRTMLPPAVAAAGFLPVVLAQRAVERGADPVSSARSSAVLVAVVAAGAAAWVRHGDELGKGWAAAAAQTSTPTTRSAE